MKPGTIYALASGAGQAGVAVVRLSGPESKTAAAALSPAPLQPRRAVCARLHDPALGEVLDDALVLWFPGPASFTGEDVVELHLHGGRAVVDGVLAALAALDGLRMAEPGEFTRRAFENGKMDLTAAEGLADLVAAETAAQRRQALRQSQGELGNLYESWRGRLLSVLAHMEATIDFSDEDLPGELATEIRRELKAIQRELTAHLADNRRGERLRDGIHLTIFGAPNVGKSSLLNLLARRDAAIVSETAGTTRDVIEVHLDLGGYPVVIADTAGLRDSDDEVEAEGVRRAHARARDADMRLAVFDAEQWPEQDAQTTAMIDEDTLVVVNKSDLKKPAEPLSVVGIAALPVSAANGDGIDQLLDALQARVAAWVGDNAAPAPTRARHREALEACAAALGRALDAKECELVAEDMRLAAQALGRITGRVDVEDLLDVIFRDFCIGK